jgi:hypothetical protein
VADWRPPTPVVSPGTSSGSPSSILRDPDKETTDDHRPRPHHRSRRRPASGRPVLADLLGLEVGAPAGPFVPVRVDADLTLDVEQRFGGDLGRHRSAESGGASGARRHAVPAGERGRGSRSVSYVAYY